MENRIILTELRMRNFKKNKNVEHKFLNVTNIFGANRSGKTTNRDALIWMLFGTDGDGNTDFDMKHKINGISEKQIEVNVEATILVNGSEIEIGRTLVEDWVTKRGSNDKVFKGHTTKYMWNNVNMPQADFNIRRDELINKEIFKLITSSDHFFSIKKVDDQRKMLLTLVNESPDNEILKELKENTPALNKLISQGENLELAKKSYAGKRKKIKDELVLIPAKITECDTNKPDVHDWVQIERDIKDRQQEIKAIDEKIIDKNNVLVEFNKSRIKDQELINEKTLALEYFKGELTKGTAEKENELNESIRTCNNSLTTIRSDFEQNVFSIDAAEKRIDFLKKNKDELLTGYKAKKESIFVFDESTNFCPTCNQKLSDAEEVKKETENNFNFAKTEILKEILEDGQNLAKEIKVSELNLIELLNKNEDLKKSGNLSRLELEKHKEALAKLQEQDPLSNEKYTLLKSKLGELELNFKTETPPVVNDAELKELKETANSNIHYLVKNLNDKETIKILDKRIELHRKNEAAMVQELLDIEKELYALEQFSNLKMQKLETEVNKLFSFIKFQLFEPQINGGVKDVCNATYNGIRYVSLSGAEKVNAGLDIINAFCNKNNIYAPIFIDNRESATEIIPVKSQVINLFVSPEDKELRFEYI